MRHRTLAATAAVALACTVTLHAQPGVGASQLLLQSPLGGGFTLRAPSNASSYILQLPDMSAVPTVGNILLMLDNSGTAPHALSALTPTVNSVLTTGGTGVVGWQTTLPSGLTLPSPTLTGGAITIGNGMPGDPGASTTTINGNVVSPALDAVYWSLNGNSATASNFIGTTNAQAFEIHVNTTVPPAGGTGRTMRYEPNATSSNIIGGFSSNSATGGATGVVIGGGGQNGQANTTSGSFSTIGGGRGNTISAISSTIAGGVLNDIAAPTSTVAGGQNNDVIGAGSVNSTIGGGLDNSVSSATTTVAGGVNNDIGTNSSTSAIGGGLNNQIGNNAGTSTIANGNGNTIGGGSTVSTISGGATNQIGIAATNGTIAGGGGNSIGDNATISTISGGSTNIIASNAATGTIGGGRLNDIAAPTSTVAGGQNNDVIGGSSVNSTIGGGLDNSTSSPTATIAGGVNNDIDINSGTSTIGGGLNNQIGSNAGTSTVAGGIGNIVGNGSAVGTISGGVNNLIGAGSGNTTIGGGNGNTVGAAAGNTTINGGLTNTVAANAFTGTIGGGTLNDIAASTSTVAGGQNNDIIGATSVNSTIGGGLDNSTSSATATIAGGVNNDISTNAGIGTIGGGLNNQITNGAAISTIAGGLANIIGGTGSAIPGGRGLTLNGSGSLGFLGGNTGSNDMSATANNTTLLGNTDLWLANNDNTARELRLYEPNATAGAFPPAGIGYTALKAGTQSGTNITYTLPTAAPGANGEVMISTTGGAMSWSNSLDLANNTAATSTMRLTNSATGGTALEVVGGRVLLSYGTVTSGGTITNDVAVVNVGDDGTGGTRSTVTLPATGANGQVIVVTTDDPDGVDVNAGFKVTNDALTALRFVWVGGGTGSWRREN